jgi:small-conductance mechanosensitive channel
MDSITQYFASVDWWGVSRMAALTVAVLAAQYLIYRLVYSLLHNKFDRKVVARKADWFRGIKVRHYQLLSPERETLTVLWLSRALRYAIYAVQVYVTLLLLFSIYPATESLAHALLMGILNPLLSLGGAFVDYFPNLLRIVVIVAVVHYFVKFLKFVMKEVGTGRLVIPGFYADWAHATFNLLRFLSYAFMVVMIFPLLPESETAAFKGVSVFLGLLFSLGSTTVIANLVAGMVITYMRSFKMGDRVKVGEVLGDVVAKTPFAVRVQTSKKEVVTVPNVSILNSNVTNFSTSADEDHGVILYMPVTVCYDVPWRKSVELLTKAALSAKGVLASPPPFVLAKELGNDAAVMELNLYTRDPEEQPRIFSEINENIRDLFEAEGISMTVPRLVQKVN